MRENNGSHVLHWTMISLKKHGDTSANGPTVTKIGCMVLRYLLVELGIKSTNQSNRGRNELERTSRDDKDETNVIQLHSALATIEVAACDLNDVRRALEVAMLDYTEEGE